MVTIVLDASVVMAWVFEDEMTPTSDRALRALDDARGLVPGLFRYEVANALVVAARRGRITRAEIAAFLTQLDALPIDEQLPPAKPATLHSTATEHTLSAYDAAYLAIAMDSGGHLATNDAALRKAAKKAGVTLV